VSAVQAERMRIARELHDVLAHSLSQINVQAAVGAHLADRDPAQAKAALVTIKEASKAALDEVRSVLGVLRDETQDARPAAPLVPEPGLAELQALLAPARAQGLPVSLEWRLGEAGPVGTAQPDARTFHRVPQTVQLAAYRIVQESLTNARRHAAGSEVRVSLSLTDDRCVVRVANGSPAGAEADRPEEEDEATTTTTGAGAGAGAGAGEGAASPAPGGGRGLIGMRERAELLGGSFEAGPGAGGGFLVQAILPFTAGGHPEPGRGPGTGGRA
jgi:signal transduction histidine kinase